MIFERNFLKIYKLNENFFHGSWKLSREPNEDHLHGQMFCKTKDFWDVNGYHEDLTEYGYDDDDLYIRLKENGIKEEYINPNHISHLVTSHTDRVKNQPYFTGVNIELKHLQLSQKKNKNYCNKFPWTPEKTRLNWNIKKVNDFFYDKRSKNLAILERCLPVKMRFFDRETLSQTQCSFFSKRNLKSLK